MERCDVINTRNECVRRMGVPDYCPNRSLARKLDAISAAHYNDS